MGPCVITYHPPTPEHWAAVKELKTSVTIIQKLYCRLCIYSIVQILTTFLNRDPDQWKGRSMLHGAKQQFHNFALGHEPWSKLRIGRCGILVKGLLQVGSI